MKHRYLDSGANPPKGAVITYYLREAAEATISLRIDDVEGNEVKTFKSLHADDEEKAAGTRTDDTPKELRIPSKAGWNRFVWDLRYPDAHKVAPHDDHQQGYIKGPHAPPGSYSVTLIVGDEEISQSFDIVKEAGVSASDADLQAQFDLLMIIRDKVSSTHKVINQMRDVRAQLKGLARAPLRPGISGGHHRRRQSAGGGSAQSREGIDDSRYPRRLARCHESRRSPGCST